MGVVHFQHLFTKCTTVQGLVNDAMIKKKLTIESIDLTFIMYHMLLIKKSPHSLP